MTTHNTHLATIDPDPLVDSSEPAQILHSPKTRPKNLPERVPAAAWRKLGLTMLIPFFLAAVMGLAYLGAFHEPHPHNVQVAVVGDTAATKVFAQTLKDKAGQALDVRTVPDVASARTLIAQRELAAAYEPGTANATLFLSSAASETTANITQKIFMPVAFSQNLPFQVVDVVPVGSHDSTGQGLFFMLVALSIGGYASSVPLSGFMGRVRLRTRFALALAAGAVVSAIGVVIAGPVYNVLQGAVWGTWLLSWLYVSAIVMLGMGLHPLLRHWTTPILTLLFVALNFTSSGGIFAPAMQPGLFGGLNAFWNGAAWYQAAQNLAYFPGQDIAFDVLKLALWLVPGALLMVLTHVWSERKIRLANENARIREVEGAIAA
ncbi:hypothetical protein SAMN04489740_0278 [Arthrobacter alpinus]|uniref:ABC transporter permease n=1 Tax=Arthrobacter alpinus TaxID=656366 RepID=A0A1H5EL17_9MICC|nr:hypothetical protein [Arthrobacter alpinus]SED91769.1 hypothetical protein SAMN04489740_0278 [Arthrobacter alpinus]